MIVEKVKERLMRNRSLTRLLQSKPKECQLVISYEIKGKIHQWSFCKEMSQNHLGDANSSFACVSISLSLCKMFCSSNSVQIPPSVDIWQSVVCNSIVEGRNTYDKISVTPGELSSFVIKDIVLTNMVRNWSLPWSWLAKCLVPIKPGFHEANTTTTTTIFESKQSD